MACALLLAARWWQRRAARPATVAPRQRTAPAAALLAALTLQAIALPLAGFVPTAAGVFAASSRALGSRHLRRDLLVGALLAGTLAALFAWGLGVPLPMGGTAP